MDPSQTFVHRLAENRDRILAIAARYSARDVRVFGSVARGEAHVGSEVDLFVRMEPDRSLLNVGGFQVEVEELLGCRVDVVTDYRQKTPLSPSRVGRILKSMRHLSTDLPRSLGCRAHPRRQASEGTAHRHQWARHVHDPSLGVRRENTRHRPGRARPHSSRRLDEERRPNAASRFTRVARSRLGSAQEERISTQPRFSR